MVLKGEFRLFCGAIQWTHLFSYSKPISQNSKNITSKKYETNRTSGLHNILYTILHQCKIIQLQCNCAYALGRSLLRVIVYVSVTYYYFTKWPL